MSPRTITVSGARGGHGATTVAVALGLLAADHGPTTVVSADPAAVSALLGVPLGLAGEWVQVTPALVLTTDPAIPATWRPTTVVIDAGSPPGATEPVDGAEYYVVLRGPCYVALAGLVAAPPARLDGIIVVAEPERSLTARDVAEVLGVPVVATVGAAPAVTRTIDAGLLVARLPRLRPLAPLRPLATDPYAGRLRPSTARARQRPLRPHQGRTDLPLSQCDNGAERSRAVKAVAPGPRRRHVETPWPPDPLPAGAEHRAPGLGCGRLLPRRGRHLRRGLLLRTG